MKEFIIHHGCSECLFQVVEIDDSSRCYLTGCNITDCVYGDFETSHPTDTFVNHRGVQCFKRMYIPSAPVHGKCPLWSEDGLVIKFKLK